VPPLAHALLAILATDCVMDAAGNTAVRCLISMAPYLTDELEGVQLGTVAYFDERSGRRRPLPHHLQADLTLALARQAVRPRAACVTYHVIVVTVVINELLLPPPPPLPVPYSHPQPPQTHPHASCCRVYWRLVGATSGEPGVVWSYKRQRSVRRDHPSH
jgi:hypothetical protein